jgi:hypothetical protein
MSAKLTISTPHLALFLARRNSGKTHLQKWILYTLAKAGRFKWVLVICPTAFTGDWGSIVGPENVLPTFDAAQVETLMERQAELREDGVENDGLIVFDDCLGSANFQSELFTKIASAGRHYRITVWASFQHYHKCPTVIRTNADLVFVMGVQNEKVLKSLYEEYGGLGFDDVKALRAYALKATQSYGSMCVDNTSAGARGSPVRTVRAPAKLPAFKIKQH